MSPGRLIFIVFFCLCNSGCIGLMQSSSGGPGSGSDVSVRTYRQKAVAFEKQGDLQQALLAWRVAALLAPDDATLPEIVKSLEQGIANTANDHFKNGVACFQRNKYDEARREFLIALRLDPGHQKAMHYLKTRLPYTDRKFYAVQRGDSLIRIATEEYGDSSMAYMVAYFNDLDPQKPLWIGTEILLPQLSPRQILPKKETSPLVDKAQKALARGHYEAALEMAARIKEQQPDNNEALRLSDEAHFALGMAGMAKKDYFAALAQFKQVGPGYEGRDQAIRKARAQIQRQNTEEKLRVAETRYGKGDFAGVINVTEELLAQEPGNPKAMSLFNAAHYALGKQLLDQGKEAQAIEVLGVLDNAYQDTAQLLNLAHARLNASAEEYYRKGVKQFLNEDLEQAIASWEKALVLNPNHPKAQQDIDNALRLLEKWRDLDQDDKNRHRSP